MHLPCASCLEAVLAIAVALILVLYPRAVMSSVRGDSLRTPEQVALASSSGAEAGQKDETGQNYKDLKKMCSLKLTFLVAVSPYIHNYT